MNRIIVLTKRNLKLFLRDKITLFFSFLSTLIMVLLYFLFIAKVYTSGMDNPDAGGIALPIASDAKFFIVYLQMMAGVLILNSMSLSVGAFSVVAKDFESRRIDNLLLTPAKTHEIILSYFATGLAASFVINAFTWVLSFVIIGLSTGYWLGFAAFLTVLLVLFVASLVSCSIMLLVTALIKSVAALGVLSGVAGTFLGFLCGIYMPYSSLGEATKAVGSFLPFTHLAAWLKKVVLDDAFSQIGISGEFKNMLYRDFFSVDGTGLCGLKVPLFAMVLLSCAFGLLCLLASYAVLQKRIKGQKESLARKAEKKQKK